MRRLRPGRLPSLCGDLVSGRRRDAGHSGQNTIEHPGISPAGAVLEVADRQQCGGLLRHSRRDELVDRDIVSCGELRSFSCNESGSRRLRLLMAPPERRNSAGVSTSMLKVCASLKSRTLCVTQR
jgi:hypothetical protein